MVLERKNLGETGETGAAGARVARTAVSVSFLSWRPRSHEETEI
jgi:hypothetical protein